MYGQRITSGICRLLAALGLALAGSSVQTSGALAQGLPPDVQALVDQGPAVQDPVQDSFVSHLDLPPDGVARLYAFSGGGAGGGCILDGVQPLNAGIDEHSPDSLVPCVLSPLGSLSLSFSASSSPTTDREGPISVRITDPSGAEVFRTDDAYHTPDWIVPMGAPLGTYSVQAAQGTWNASGTLSVKADADRIIRALPSYAPPGSTFHLLLAGYKPLQPVRLLLFHGQNGAVFSSELPPVTTDQSGQAIYTLHTSADDPVGEYSVDTIPPTTTGLTGGAWRTFRVATSETRSTEEVRNDALWAAQAVVEQATTAWANAVGAGGSATDLDCAFEAQAFQPIQADILAMRSRGQYRIARRTAPPRVRDLSLDDEYGNQFRVTMDEQWDDAVYAADGSLVQQFPSRVTRQYVVQQYTTPEKSFGAYLDTDSDVCHMGRVIIAANPSVGQTTLNTFDPSTRIADVHAYDRPRTSSCSPRLAMAQFTMTGRVFVTPARGADLYAYMRLEPDFKVSLDVDAYARMPSYSGGVTVNIPEGISTSSTAPTRLPMDVPLAGRDGATTTAHVTLLVSQPSTDRQVDIKLAPAAAGRESIACDPPIK